MHITKKLGITDLIYNYNEALRHLREGFEHFHEAEKHLRINEGSSIYTHIIPPNTRFYDLNNAIKEAELDLKKNTWKRIIDISNIKQFLTIAKNEKLTSQINDFPAQLPEITIDNIQTTLESYYNNTDNLLKETVKEVFEWLIPNHFNSHKTNKTHMISNKIIKTGIIDNWGVNYYRQKNITALDNVFHLLDGKGVAKYPNDLNTIINNIVNTHENKTCCETDYFHCKWYGNGNIHITFKRLDLVEKLNKYGSEEDKIAEKK